MHLIKTLTKLWIISILLIIISYYYFDKEVSTFVYTHHWGYYLNPLRSIVEWPALVVYIAPFTFLGMLCFMFYNKTLKNWQKLLLSISICIIITFLLKNEFKWIFSRYWPETWINNNPSWINNQAYGFNWFKGYFFLGTNTVGSFPSGHSAIAFATLLPIGLFFRRFFLPAIIISSIEAIAMVCFNYHFVSDVIAGSALGISCVLLTNNVIYKKTNF